MEDEAIIGMLFDRNDAALPEIAKKYGRLYAGVLRGILNEESDIEECANDVLLSAWNSIPPNRPERLAPYLCTLAKRTGIDRVRYNTRQKRSPGFLVLLSELEECYPGEEPAAPDDTAGEVLRDAMNRFLRGLDPAERILFLRRYVYGESPASLAGRFGMKENTVCARLLRTRKKLKRFLTNEEITI